MSTTLFREVGYALSKLMDDIEMGEIGLPEYLSRYQHALPYWLQDAKAATLLAGALENDH